jgi:RimJ/RimL family protein N-acetyltransferase
MNTTLSTNRLIIRQMKEDDISSMTQLLKEKKIRSFINLPNNLQKLKRYIVSYQKKRRKGKTIRWIIILPQSKKII